MDPACGELRRCAANAWPPRRVLLLVSSLRPGGTERQVVQLANHLDPRRFEVHVAVLAPEVPLAAELHRRSARLHLVEKRWRFDPGTVRRAADLMRRLGPDLVHAFLFDAEMVARLAARRARVPVVIASERNADYRRPWRHRLGHWLTRGLYDALIANSEAGRRFSERTLGLPAHRIHVVHNGVDTRRFRPGAAGDLRSELGLAADTPLLALVGSFKRQKNHELALRALDRVRRRVPDVRLLCVGDTLGPAGGLVRPGSGMHGDTSGRRREILALADRLGLHAHLLLIGPQERIERVYAACDLLILTSRHEGTPNVVLEAMACGRPVVTTDVSDARRIVPDGRAGYVVPLDDRVALADRILDLLLDEDRRCAMGAAARTWVESEFSNEALARRTGEIYERELARKLGRPADPAIVLPGAGDLAAAGTRGERA